MIMALPRETYVFELHGCHWSQGSLLVCSTFTVPGCSNNGISTSGTKQLQSLRSIEKLMVDELIYEENHCGPTTA